MHRILELKITREEAHAHSDVQNTVKAKQNSEYIEETNTHDYVRNELNTYVLEEKSGDENVNSCQAKSKLSSAVIESNIEHSENVVTSSSSISDPSHTAKDQEGPNEHYSSFKCGRSPKTKINSDALEEKSGDKNVKPFQTESELSSAVIESNIEHSEDIVTSSSPVNDQYSTNKAQEGPSEHYSSSRCGRSPKTKRNHKINSNVLEEKSSDKVKSFQAKSELSNAVFESTIEYSENAVTSSSSVGALSHTAKIQEGPGEHYSSSKCERSPKTKRNHKINSEESIQLETSAQFIELLAEIQNDLIKLDYIKNYNDQEHSSTEEYINSTQSKYFLVQNDKNHMLISEERLEKLTAQNPIVADMGIQSVQENPIKQN